ncbi:MAG TPA: hypothetical protein VN228_12455 [Pyrinomonadaceae bacterium]|nr:hypothetical protein [Pyrinomonadaceae bacterium]
MTLRRAFKTALLCGLLCWAGAGARAQQFDIGSGGLPTITGATGGTVTGSADVTQNLVVNVNFGDVSPINTSNVVRVVVPVSIRSTGPYQVTVTAAGLFDPNPQAVQRTDIGFGARNLRQLGNKARDCNRGTHLFRTPFDNDPAASLAFDAQGRAAYPATLASLSTPVVILSGPELTKGNSITKKEPDNGYVFDAVFVIKPQFFAAGNFNVTLTFNIAPGPNVQC